MISKIKNLSGFINLIHYLSKRELKMGNISDWGGTMRFGELGSNVYPFYMRGIRSISINRRSRLQKMKSFSTARYNKFSIRH